MYKKVKLINHDCLPILMLLYIMLAYLMLLAALSNAVCLYIAFFAIDFCKCFLSSCLVLVCWHIVCLFQVWFSIMRSAFNLLVFPNSMSTPFFIWKGHVLSGEIALKNNDYYYYSTINILSFFFKSNSYIHYFVLTYISDVSIYAYVKTFKMLMDIRGKKMKALEWLNG